MKLTYRTRRRLHRLGVGFGYLLLAVLLVGVCWVVWLGRFAVYTGDGVRFDFNRESPAGTPVVAQPPEEETIVIHYNEGEEQINISTELTQLRGYYATAEVLGRGVEGVAELIGQLPADSAIMLDVKGGFGTFYYSSGLEEAPTADLIDVTQMDRLIAQLAASDTYLIARVSAFRDRNYGLNHTNYGLAVADGGYLWADEENCYWLNPASTGALSWIISVTNELRDLGFDEVVFTDFRFPDTDNITFDSSMSRQEALESAAQTLVDACATSRFCVSFETDNASFKLPQGRSRLYLTDVAANQVEQIAESTTVADKTIGLVFLTSTNDTRFDAYGAMRPMPGLN